MTIIAPDLHVQDDNLSRLDTSTAPQSPQSMTFSISPLDPTTVLRPADPISLSRSPSAHNLETSNPLLPIPTHLLQKPHASLTLSDIIEDLDSLEPLSQDLGNADVSIAADTSFIELSSGPAARELKRRWDLRIGVGKAVRSPYAITAFVNQHGKQMYRVSRRELSAPAANAVEMEERISHSAQPGDSPKAARRSRMSINAFPSMFKNGATPRAHGAALQPPVSRKLRRARSNSDMIGVDSENPNPTSITGRAHSRSVTGADVTPFLPIIHSEPPPHDFFSEVMDWSVPPQTPSSSRSTHSLTSSMKGSHERYDYFKPYTRIAYPFGPGITFDAPYRKTTTDGSFLLPVPRFLREVQSFESGLTARQTDLPRTTPGTPPIIFESEQLNSETERPPSALRIQSFSAQVTFPAEEVTPEPVAAPALALAPRPPPPMPSAETAAFSHYSTEVFDVLQTYRGLPLLDKLSFETEPTTVKMSLAADESAAPRDDPRFVIWGELHPDRDSDDRSMSHDSVTDLSVLSSSLSISKRKTSKARPPEQPGTRSSSTGRPQKVLLAATIERWIAQLTSDLNYDELLDFFLTYRTYVDSVELCRLLISRFHWALHPPTSAHDEKVRRIVRVRTFVAIRYWLLTFFTVDFLPKRELRLLVSHWLSALIKDPLLKKHVDGLGIVRKLIKVAKECKQAHIPSSASSRPRASSEPQKHVPVKPHVLGEKFAAATRKSMEEDAESDLDLDFIPDEGAISGETLHFTHDPANAHLAVAHSGATSVSPARPSSSIPFSSLSILQRTDHAPGPGTEPETTFVQTSPAQLPVHHNAISRVFVKTIGRLGRWRRVLNSRTTTTRTSLGACADVSAFDLEMNMSRDLLATSGGVEVLQTVVAPRAILPIEEVTSEESEVSHNEPLSESPAVADVEESSKTGTVDALNSTAVDPPDGTLSRAEIPGTATPTLAGDVISATLTLARANVDDDTASLRSSSTDSFGQPLGEGTGAAPTFSHFGQSQWQFDVASIDDFELSDASSDGKAPPPPPGLRRPPRKLPLRREFEFVKRPETVSSMGIVSHRDSVPSNTSSVVSSASIAGLGAGVARWQLTALVDSLSDDDEKGDVEDALRRLEGQINVQKQQEKASKVDGWVRSIRERMAAGDYKDDESIYSDEEGDEEGTTEDEKRLGLDVDVSSGTDDLDESASQHDVATTPSLPATNPSSLSGRLDGSEEDVLDTPVPAYTTYVPPISTASSPLRTFKTRPLPEAVVPVEILKSRVPPRPTTADASIRTSISRFPTSPIYDPRRIHRSFILNYRASTLADHFAMIDRELFMSIKFEELVLDDWMSCKEVHVLDWGQFLKDRARWKAESRFPNKTSALAAVRGRFNLMVIFTISEILLTLPNDRSVLVAKFIRIAWKSYLMSNFSTLVAIITALGSEWVTKAMRRPGWNRVGIWENRMLKDLKVFASPVEDFKYIRQVVASIADAKPLDMTSHASVTSGGGGGGGGGGGVVVGGGGGADAQGGGRSKGSGERPLVPTACIPFIGIYLSQLQRHSRLPDLIDPTAPDEAVGINPETSNFDAPAHPEVFSALATLPESMNLEPLINVHKQRRIAGVIKSLVAGQHLASRVHFDVDKKLFQKALRLRGLSPNILQRVFELHE